MKLPHRRGQGGSILILTIVVLFIVTGLTASLLTLSVTGHVVSRVNQKRAVAKALAEGSVELAKDWLQNQYANQGVTAVSATTANTVDDLVDPAHWKTTMIDDKPVRFAMLAIPPSLEPAPTGASLVQLTPDKKGWSVDGPDGVRTFHNLYAIYGRAEDGTKKALGDSTVATASVTQVVEVVSTPLFQFAVFYNSDLEILPGPSMTLTGRVHTNRDLYLGCGDTLKLDTTYVRAAGNMYRMRKNDGSATGGSVLIKNLAMTTDKDSSNDFTTTMPKGSSDSSAMWSSKELASMGVSTKGGFDSTFGGYDMDSNGSLGDSGDWKPWASQAMAFWGGTVQTGDMGVGKCAPPSKTLALDAFAPCANGDYAPDGFGGYAPVSPGTGSFSKGYFHQKAGLSIVNGSAFTADGTNVSAALLPGTISATTIYDAREKKSVPLVKVDITLLNQSLAPTAPPVGALATKYAALKSSWNGLMYATLTGASASTPKGVMLTNGSELPDSPTTGAKIGLTVVSDLPCYVAGDYNTSVGGKSSPTNDPAFRKPAAIIADAVNLLSNSWDGSKSSGSGIPNATPTTFNTAIVSGNTDSIPGVSYNGGLENLPRFHENWTDVNCRISGSLINLWKSKIATSPWFYGSPVYTAPNRLWDFDPNFKSFAKLPPFTPVVVDVRDVASQ